MDVSGVSLSCYEQCSWLSMQVTGVAVARGKGKARPRHDRGRRAATTLEFRLHPHRCGCLTCTRALAAAAGLYLYLYSTARQNVHECPPVLSLRSDAPGHNPCNIHFNAQHVLGGGHLHEIACNLKIAQVACVPVPVATGAAVHAKHDARSCRPARVVFGRM